MEPRGAFSAGMNQVCNIDELEKMLTPRVVQLNVGGVRYTTVSTTLRKHPGSMLVEMLQHAPRQLLDPQGCIFIDRPGQHFGLILEYLRSGEVPAQHQAAVLREARWYRLDGLAKQLEDAPAVFGEQVARRQFVLRVPGYGENLELLVRLARAEAVAARRSAVQVCAVRDEDDAAHCAAALRALQDKRGSVVTFGPWKAAPDVTDLLDCVLLDLQARGYRAAYEPTPGMGRAARGKAGFYTFIFTWW